MTYDVLLRALGRDTTEPDVRPTPTPDPTCTCRAFDGHGQNPECPKHPWWRQDEAVLHLADLTRELGSAWAAAQSIDWKSGS